MAKFSKSTIALLFCSVFLNIAGLFSGSFLVAYFYSHSANYILTIGVYNMLLFALLTIISVLLCFVITNAKWRDAIFRLGIVFKCLSVLLIVLLKDKLESYIVMLALITGIGEALYYTSFHTIKSEISSDRKIFEKYAYTSSIINQTINIVMPIILGIIIDVSSYLQISIYIFVICLIALGCSFFIKSRRLKDGNFNLIAYIKKLKSEKQKYKPLKYLYISAFAVGMRAVVGTLAAVIIMMTFGSNVGLGVNTSFITVVAMIFLTIYVRSKRLKKSKSLFIFNIVAPLLTAVILLSSMGRVTFLIFNVCFVIACTSLDYQIDINRYSLVKQLNLTQDTIEHQSMSEISLGVSRIMGYAFLALIGLTHSMLLVKLLLFVSLFSVSIMTLALRKLQN